MFLVCGLLIRFVDSLIIKYMPIIRRIIRSGHSNIVGLPEEVRKHLDIVRGDYVAWHIDKDKRVFLDKLTAHAYPGLFIPGSGVVNDAK